MASLPALQQSLSQLLQILQSNNALFRPKDDGLDGQPQAPQPNAAANTVFRIPEILAQIFLFALSSELYASISRNIAPLNICQVCRFWRTVAVGFPPLWKSFSLTFDGEEHSDSKIQLFSLLLERTKNYPLSVKLIFGKTRGARLSAEIARVANLVLLTLSQNNSYPVDNLYLVIPPECSWFIPAFLTTQHSERIRTLAVDVFGSYQVQRTLEDFDFRSLVRHTQLESLILLNYTVSSPPTDRTHPGFLHQLVLVYDFLPGSDNGGRTRPNSFHCLSALRYFPSLESFCVSLHWSAVGSAANLFVRNSCTPVDHDKLKKLCIIAGDSNGELDAFLGNLNLPCLHAFELRCRTTAVLSDGLQRFVGNSSTLEEVALFGRNTPADMILDCLAILPNLKRLSLVQLPHIVSFLQALSYQPVGFVERMEKKRMCLDLESLTIEDLPGNSIPLNALSHFIRSRRWYDDPTVRGAVKTGYSPGLKLLRVPASQTKELFKLEAIWDCVRNGLKIERYEEEHTAAYLSGKDFFHL